MYLYATATYITDGLLPGPTHHMYDAFLGRQDAAFQEHGVDRSAFNRTLSHQRSIYITLQVMVQVMCGLLHSDDPAGLRTQPFSIKQIKHIARFNADCTQVYAFSLDLLRNVYMDPVGSAVRLAMKELWLGLGSMNGQQLAVGMEGLAAEDEPNYIDPLKDDRYATDYQLNGFAKDDQVINSWISKLCEHLKRHQDRTGHFPENIMQGSFRGMQHHMLKNLENNGEHRAIKIISVSEKRRILFSKRLLMSGNVDFSKIVGDIIAHPRLDGMQVVILAQGYKSEHTFTTWDAETRKPKKVTRLVFYPQYPQWINTPSLKLEERPLLQLRGARDLSGADQLLRATVLPEYDEYRSDAARRTVVFGREAPEVTLWRQRLRQFGLSPDPAARRWCTLQGLKVALPGGEASRGLVYPYDLLQQSIGEHFGQAARRQQGSATVDFSEFTLGPLAMAPAGHLGEQTGNGTVTAEQAGAQMDGLFGGISKESTNYHEEDGDAPHADAAQKRQRLE